MSQGDRRTRMTTREIVLWFVFAVAAAWGAVWLTWGATIATVAVVITVPASPPKFLGFVD